MDIIPWDELDIDIEGKLGELSEKFESLSDWCEENFPKLIIKTYNPYPDADMSQNSFTLQIALGKNMPPRYTAKEIYALSEDPEIKKQWNEALIKLGQNYVEPKLFAEFHIE